MGRSRIELTQSGVAFNEATHTYTLDGKELVGITGLIHDKVFPDMYKGIPDAVLAKAAERGKAVHKNIEDYDRGLFACTTAELANYIKGCESNGLVHEESEYLVTDREYYASAIDKVYRVNDTEFILADIKTTSKLNIEYVAWQLSIYAYLFEHQVKGASVKNLLAIWIRGEECEFRQVDRKSDEDVERLLNCGKTNENFLAPTNDELPEQVSQILREIAEMEQKAKELSEKSKSLKEALEREMREHNVQKWTNDFFEVTLTQDYEKKAFDSTRLKKDNPNLYNDYLKTSMVKGHINIKIK